MLKKTRGIVLRSVKFGDSSLVTTVFTEQEGVQSYLMKGVRNPRSGQQRTGLLQPGSLLDLVVYHNPQKNLQRIREFQSACHDTSLQEDVIKNSIGLFCIEILLRVLPEHAPHPALFDFAFKYFTALDITSTNACANFPLFFLIRCGRLLGYELHGAYSESTPYPNPETGRFEAMPPDRSTPLNPKDVIALDRLIRTRNLDELSTISMVSTGRLKLIDWYLSFLQYHTQHMGAIRSLTVLQTVLHPL